MLLDRDPAGPHVSEGVRAARAHIKRTNESIPKFCEKHGLDRLQLQRILDGRQKRVSVEFAAAFEKASNGEVELALWALMAPTAQKKRTKAGA